MERKKPESDLVDPNEGLRKISKERRKYAKEHAFGMDEADKKEG
jgi:hypothetical protein